jgi:hypothetical protein
MADKWLSFNFKLVRQDGYGIAPDVFVTIW